jgi:hypothetical protein
MSQGSPPFRGGQSPQEAQQVQQLARERRQQAKPNAVVSYTPPAIIAPSSGLSGAAGGDLTGTFPNPTLVIIGSAATVGDATHIPVLSVDINGRTTAATSVAVFGVPIVSDAIIVAQHKTASPNIVTFLPSNAATVPTATAGSLWEWETSTDAGTTWSTSTYSPGISVLLSSGTVRARVRLNGQDGSVTSWTTNMIQGVGGSAATDITYGLATANVVEAFTVHTVSGALTSTDNRQEYDCTSGAKVATLPAASTYSGPALSVIKIDASANTLTLTSAGSDTINAAATKVFSAQYAVATVIRNAAGTGWRLL